jgi:hypothetical protein
MRSRDIFRSASTFREVLECQQSGSQMEDPCEDEADYLFTMKDNLEDECVIREIVRLSQIQAGGSEIG